MTILRNLRWWLDQRFVPFFSGPDPHHTQQRNIWRLYQDLIWLGLASAAATYIDVYALRLGASKELIGLRASIPSLIVVLLRIPAARLMEKTSDRKSLIVRSLAAARLIYVLIALLPWLAYVPLLKQVPQASLLIGLVILMSVPSSLSMAGWDTLFADVVPAERRARVVSMRNTWSNLMMLSVVPLMGLFLDRVRFPLNYQLIFFLAFCGAMLSTWHVSKIRVAQPSVGVKRPKALNFAEARQIVQGSPEFAALLWATFIYQWGVSLASPLFSVYMVDKLGASDSWMGWQATLASLASIVAYRFWPRRVERHGERAILTLAAPMMLFYPLLTSFTTSLTPNLFIILLPRLFGAAVMLARYNILLRVSPADHRPTYIAIYAILNNVAAFVAPMVGVRLADAIGIRGVFLAAAGVRLLAALLYQRLPRDVPAPEPDTACAGAAAQGSAAEEAPAPAE